MARGRAQRLDVAPLRGEKLVREIREPAQPLGVTEGIPDARRAVTSRRA